MWNNKWYLLILLSPNPSSGPYFHGKNLRGQFFCLWYSKDWEGTSTCKPSQINDSFQNSYKNVHCGVWKQHLTIQQNKGRHLIHCLYQNIDIVHVQWVDVMARFTWLPIWDNELSPDFPWTGKLSFLTAQQAKYASWHCSWNESRALEGTFF